MIIFVMGMKVDPKNKNQHKKFISLRNFKIKTMKIFEFLKEKFQTKRKNKCKNIFWAHGMGLAKSYLQNGRKICLYNTINGQDKLIYNDINTKCQKFWKN